MSGISLLLMAASAGLNVTATPPSLNSAGLAVPFTTAEVTAIVSGGSGTYTYAWAVGDAPAPVTTFTINAPTAATTDVEIDAFASGAIIIGSIICTVTDTVTLDEATVEVNIRHRDQGTPP